MNTNNETTREQIIGQSLMTDQHEALISATLDTMDSNEFNELLISGRNAINELRTDHWSLCSSAADLGIDIQELGKSLRMPLDALQKLDLRLLKAASLPDRLFDLIADVLLVPTDYIRHYVQMPPAIPAGIRFHAESGSPQIILETFEDAMLDDDDLTEHDRLYWLGKQC